MPDIVYGRPRKGHPDAGSTVVFHRACAPYLLPSWLRAADIAKAAELGRSDCDRCGQPLEEGVRA